MKDEITIKITVDYDSDVVRISINRRPLFGSDNEIPVSGAKYDLEDIGKATEFLVNEVMRIMRIIEEGGWYNEYR